MTLISLLLALSLESWQMLPSTWHWEEMHERSKRLCQPLVGIFSAGGGCVYALVIMALATGVISMVLPGFLSFVFSTLILAVCLGNPEFRQGFRHYQEAVRRQDWTAADLHVAGIQSASNANNISNSEQDIPGVEHAMSDLFVWCHYRYYSAVLVWFVILGPVGAVLYVGITRGSDPAQGPVMAALQKWLDVVSARVVAFLLLLVGHFSRGIEQYLSLFTQSVSPQHLLLNSARVSEPHQVNLHAPDGSDSLTRTRALMKRGVYAWLVMVALATLAGWL